MNTKAEAKAAASLRAAIDAAKSHARRARLPAAHTAETIESVCEPYLLRSGFLARTPRGRMATLSAWQHLGLTPPPSDHASNHGEIPLHFGD